MSLFEMSRNNIDHNQNLRLPIPYDTHDIAVLRDGDRLAIPNGNRIGIYSLSARSFVKVLSPPIDTEEGLEYCWKIEAVNKDVLVSIVSKSDPGLSEAKCAFVWRVSEDNLMQIINVLNLSFLCIVNSGEFLLQTRNGIEVYQYDGSSKYCSKGIFRSYVTQTISGSSHWNGRVAITGEGGTEIFHVDTLSRVAYLPDHFRNAHGIPASVALLEQFVVVGYKSAGSRIPILVYEYDTLNSPKCIWKQKTGLQFPHLVTASCTSFILSGLSDKALRLYDARNTKKVWKTKLDGRVRKPKIVNENCIAVLTNLNANSEVVILSPPSQIANEIEPFLHSASTDEITIASPLQMAYFKCYTGELSPAKQCKALINRKACGESVQEFQAAHNLVHLAIMDGEIPPSTDYNGKGNYWFLNLYYAFSDLEFKSTEEHHLAIQCLKHAKELGLIETVEGVLGASLALNEARAEIKNVHRAGIQLFEQLIALENRFDRLKMSYERYLRTQRLSNLLGIALQVIPIVGGVTASALGAGVNLAFNLELKDVADYGLPLANIIVQHGIVDSSCKNVIYCAAKLLSPLGLRGMDLAKRTKMEREIKNRGLSVKDLHKILSNRDVLKSMSSTQQNTNALEKSETINNNDLVRRDEVLKMSKKELAEVWAVYALEGAEEERRDRMKNALIDCLFNLLVRNDIDAEVFVRDTVCIDMIQKKAEDAIYLNEEIDGTIGLLGRLKMFIENLRS